MSRFVPLKLALLMSLGEPAGADAGQLRQQAEEFAGQSIALDARLQVPDCAQGYSLGWAGSARSAVSATCGSSGWRLLLPLAATAPTNRIKRGQILRVEAAGQGFRLSVDAIAEGQGASGGAVTVRNSISGRRFGAIAGSDGRAYFSAQGEMR